MALFHRSQHAKYRIYTSTILRAHYQLLCFAVERTRHLPPQCTALAAPCEPSTSRLAQRIALSSPPLPRPAPSHIVSAPLTPQYYYLNYYSAFPISLTRPPTHPFSYLHYYPHMSQHLPCRTCRLHHSHNIIIPMMQPRVRHPSNNIIIQNCRARGPPYHHPAQSRPALSNIIPILFQYLSHLTPIPSSCLAVCLPFRFAPTPHVALTHVSPTRPPQALSSAPRLACITPHTLTSHPSTPCQRLSHSDRFQATPRRPRSTNIRGSKFHPPI